MKRIFSLRGIAVQNDSVTGSYTIGDEKGFSHVVSFKVSIENFENDEFMEKHLFDSEKERDRMMKTDIAYLLLEKYGNRKFEADF